MRREERGKETKGRKGISVHDEQRREGGKGIEGRLRKHKRGRKRKVIRQERQFVFVCSAGWLVTIFTAP